MKTATLLTLHRSENVSIDASTDATVKIPLHRGRIAWRLLSCIAAILASAYTLITTAIHISDHDVLIYAVGWRIGVTAFVLVISAFAALKEFARLQSLDPGLIVSPTGIVINSEASRWVSRRIAWASIAAIEDKRLVKGKPGVGIKLRDDVNFYDDASFLGNLFSRRGGLYIAISPQSLMIGSDELRSLLRRYFDVYGRRPVVQEKQ
jgi:hypothetical protein